MFSGETFGLEAPGWRATVFIFAVGLFILFLIGVYIADVTQTKHAIRRNYPVIGHFRYYFEHIGTFFRQYFFTMDREEMPFNRALLRGTASATARPTTRTYRAGEWHLHFTRRYLPG